MFRIIATIDGLITDFSGLHEVTIRNRYKAIELKLENVEEIKDTDISFITLLHTIEHCLELFNSYISFDKKEPNHLNRHWIMHGRSRKKFTKLDCIKIVNLLYVLILINNICET